MKKALIIIPTYNHGGLLRYTVESILRQTYTNFEIHIIGDGATEETMATATALATTDTRIRWHSYPKSKRTGEEYRDEIIRKYTTINDFVCYLADDDLWFPDHLVLCAEALQDTDVIHTLPWHVAPGHQYRYWWCDWSLPYYRHEVLHGVNRVPLGMVAHTVVAYLSLPIGWESTPIGIGTDHHLWRKFLRHPRLRYGFVPVPTVVHMPSSLRRDRTPEQRLAELTHYAKRVETDPEALRAEVLVQYTRESLGCIAELEQRVARTIQGKLGERWTFWKAKYFDKSTLARFMRQRGLLK